MFSRQSGRVAICLRCQAKALLQAGRSCQPFALSEVRRSRFHSSISSLEQADALSLSQTTRNSESSPHGNRYKNKRLFIRGKLRGKKGREVREDTAALPVHSLGKPAEVIILRDAGIEQEEDTEALPTFETSGPSQRLSNEEILASLAQDKRTSSQAEVDEQIRALRPTNTRDGHISSIGKQDYEALHKALVDSFTSQQLKSHLKRNQPDAELPAVADKRAGFAPWRLGTSSIEKALSQAKYRTATGGTSLSAKQKFAARIIQELWHTDIAQDVNSVGELEIQISRPCLTLFMANDSSILRDIGSRNQVRLEIRAPDNVVRITAPKEPALTALHQIENVSKSLVLKSRRLSKLLSHLRPRQRSLDNQARMDLDDRTLALVSSVSNTAISLEKSKDGNQELKIIAANITEHDDALRVLRVLFGDLANGQNQAIPGSDSYDDALRQPIWSSELLPPLLQRQEYVRYQSVLRRSDGSDGQVNATEESPIIDDARPASSNTTSSPTDIDNLKPLLPAIGRELDIPVDGYVPQSSSDVMPGVDSSLWQQLYQDETSASVGHVLFPIQRELQRSTFVDVVPCLHQLLSFLQQGQTESYECYSSLVFRLAPFIRTRDVPEEVRRVADFMPDIFVEFPVNNPSDLNKDQALPIVSAVLNHKSAFLMFPHLASDLRIDRMVKQTQRIQREAVLGPSMQEWIQKTQEGINLGETVQAHSSRVHIAITPQFLSALGSDTKEARAKELSQGGTPLTTPYFYATVEHRQRVSMTFEGYPLILTSREGGKLGGRGSELKLLMPSSHPYNIKEKSTERETFYRAAYRLAKLVDDAVHGRLSNKRNAQSHSADEGLSATNATPLTSSPDFNEPQTTLDESVSEKTDHERREDTQQPATSMSAT